MSVNRKVTIPDGISVERASITTTEVSQNDPSVVVPLRPQPLQRVARALPARLASGLAVLITEQPPEGLAEGVPGLTLVRRSSRLNVNYVGHDSCIRRL
jgi:hypothetical protein